MPRQEIHIGGLIKSKLEDDGRSVPWLAKKIGCERGNIYKIFDKYSIDSEQLLSISLALGKDFHAYYSDFYKNSIENRNNTHETETEN